MVAVQLALALSARHGTYGRIYATLLTLALILAACGQPQLSANIVTATARATGVPSRVGLVTPGTPLVTPIVNSTIRATVARTPVGTAPSAVSPPRATATASPVAPSGEIPGLAEALRDVTAIDLQDDWDGLTPVAPVEARFELRPDGAGYSGTARFKAGGSFYPQAKSRSADRAVAVPADAVRSFLVLLATAQGESGTYNAQTTHTDDYPNIRIALTTARGPVVFSSKSQGAGYVPWKLEIAGVADGFVLDNDMPHRALDLLMPYLDYETLDLLKDASETGNSISKPAELGLCGGRSSPAPRTPSILAVSPRDPVAEFDVDRAYSLTITGWGVAPLPQDRKLVRDPAELAALIALIHTPLPQTERPVRYNDDVRNDVRLLWRTTDGREVRFSYDPQLGAFSIYSNGQVAYYAVTPSFRLALSARLCPAT